MSVIQPGCFHGGDEELGSVGIGTGVRHRQNPETGMLQGEVFIRELVAIDGLTAGTIVIGKVTPLAHEIRNDAVECGTLVSEAVLSGTESAEVFGCFRNHVTS